MGYIGCVDKWVEIGEVEENVEIDIDTHDMKSLIDGADPEDQRELLNYLLKKTGGGKGRFTTVNTLEGDMKEEWWAEAKTKYSLTELEEILGNKFDLM